MRIWEGPLVIPEPVERGAQPKDETVHARVVLKEPTAVPVVDVRDGVDGVGNPRWRAATPREFDPVSILRALAMTQHLLTDLGPFIESERDAERAAWARLVRAEDRMHGPPGAICVPSEKTEREYEAAKQALRDLGVDVDALLEEP